MLYSYEDYIKARGVLNEILYHYQIKNDDLETVDGMLDAIRRHNIIRGIEDCKCLISIELKKLSPPSPSNNIASYNVSVKKDAVDDAIEQSILSNIFEELRYNVDLSNIADFSLYYDAFNSRHTININISDKKQLFTITVIDKRIIFNKADAFYKNGYSVSLYDWGYGNNSSNSLRQLYIKTVVAKIKDFCNKDISINTNNKNTLILFYNKKSECYYELSNIDCLVEIRKAFEYRHLVDFDLNGKRFTNQNELKFEDFVEGGKKNEN